MTSHNQLVSLIMESLLCVDKFIINVCFFKQILSLIKQANVLFLSISMQIIWLIWDVFRHNVAFLSRKSLLTEFHKSTGALNRAAATTGDTEVMALVLFLGTSVQ